MSKEEKKAIEIIKQEIDKHKAIETPKEVYITDIKMLLNLVEKQQKDYISKDKIREKIKELEEQMQQDEVDEFGIHSIGWGTLDYVVEQFKELLEEN